MKRILHSGENLLVIVHLALMVIAALVGFALNVEAVTPAVSESSNITITQVQHCDGAAGSVSVHTVQAPGYAPLKVIRRCNVNI